MRTFFRTISILLLLFTASFALGQTTNYVSGDLDVDVTVVNACDGQANGSITFTVNASSQPSATLSAVLGPPTLLTPQVIPVGGSFTFDNGGAGLPANDYDFLIADGVDNINSFGGAVPTVMDYPTIDITTDTRTDNTSCVAPNGVIEVTLTGGSGSYTYTVTSPNGFSDAGTAVASDQLSYTGLEGGTYTFDIQDDLTDCFNQTDIVITEPAFSVSLDTTTPNTRCVAPFDGAASVTVTGGSGSYSYDWVGPNGYTGNVEDISGLENGSYTLTVTDLLNGCTAGVVANVADNTPTIGITIANVDDNSDCVTPNGAIDITPGGGSAYTYSWTGPGGFTSTDQDITGLLEGSYDVLVTDASGCTATATVPVGDAKPTIDIAENSTVGTSNCTTPDGSISVTISGGTGYTYAWTGPLGYTSSTEDITGLEPGSYDLLVTDIATNCTATTTINVPDNRPDITISLDSNIASSSCSTPNGSLSITPGGAGSFTYSWTGPNSFTSSSEDITGLEPGTYTVVVTDVISTCTETDNFTVGDSSPTISITVDASVDNTHCLTPNGSISITPTGASVYTYSWTGPGGFTSTSQDIIGLIGGSYDVIVTDGTSGCTATENIVIADNPPTIDITLDINTDNTNCVGYNGALSITPSGGTGYTYAWTGPTGFTSTSEDITALEPGAYTIIVTDVATGCTDTDVFNVADSSPTVTVNVDTSVDNTSCVAGNGSIDITAGGGGAYTYAWTGPGGFTSTDEDIATLLPGTYDVIVTDTGSGCTATTSVDILDLPPTITINTDTNAGATSCSAPDGVIEITAGGGAAYTYTWTGPNSFSSSDEDLSGLEPGDYNITVTEVATGCTATTIINVADNTPVISIDLDTNTDNTSCVSPNGVLEITPQGGTTYTIGWTGPTGFSSSSEDISGLEPGTYSVTVTDDISGCSASATYDIIDSSPTITVSVDNAVDNTNCVGPNGSIDITAGGGTSYTYAWTDGVSFNSTSEDLSALPAATYTLIVTDVPSGCTATVDVPISDNTPDLVVTDDLIDPFDNCLSDNGAIMISVSGGSGYTYSWTGPGGFSSTNEDISGLIAGDYDITVTEVASGCTTTETYNVPDITPSLVITVNNVTDNTDCDSSNGAIEVSVTGATNLEFSWTGPLGYSSTLEDISGLVGGSYTLTVTDLDSDCSVTQAVAVTELASPITVTGSVTDNTKCNPVYDGAIDITQSGATSPTYSWTGPNGFTSTDEDIFNLEPGTYFVTVSELGCSTSDSYDVLDLSSPVGVTGNVTDNTSCSAPNGTITLNLTGSTGPTNYIWSGPGGFSSTSRDLTGLAAGTYEVIVTENNCDTFASFNIIDIVPTLSITIDNTTENTSCSVPNGAIGITPSGATNYTYSWTSGAGFTSSNEDISGLIGDTYTITLTDDDTGCSIVENITIDESASPITLNASITDNSECLVFNGAIDVTASSTGGTEVYSWTGPNGFTSSDEDISNLEAGAYTLQVSESGCTTIGNYFVNDLAPRPLINVDQVTDNTQCSGPFDGSIDVTVSMGTGPYSYVWTGPNGYFSSSEDIANLDGGTYDLVVTDDATGCTSTTSLLVGDPPPSACGVVCNGFSWTFNNSAPGCGLTDGSLVFDNIAYNGTPLVDYQVTIQELVNGSPVGLPRVEPNPPGGVISGWGAGEYQ